MIEIRVLGPVEASASDEALALGGAKQRAVLAMLALQANSRVSADQLIAGLWGEEPPVSAAKMVQNYVWRLRTALPRDADTRIVTRGRGYELRIDPAGVDVMRFERLVAEAGRVTGAGGPTTAAREALALWRGPALADVADEPFAAPEIRRLDELRAEAAERAIEADLAAGRHGEVAAEIDALVREHPLRERVHALRMLALYRRGRQAEALEAYREARSTLVEAVGVEPGAELRRLHQAILEQDPALDIDPVSPELPPPIDPTGAPPLIGRAVELARLREGWERAWAGAGRMTLVAGEGGMGKTRLAAELAAEIHPTGAAVLYADGGERPEAALAVMAQAHRARRPTLIVVEDADATGAGAAALAELSGDLAGKPLLLLATARGPHPLSEVADDAFVLGALGPSGVAAIARLYVRDAGVAEEQAGALLAASGGVPARVHEAAAAWARREAARRVGELVPRTAAGRTELREAETGLAEGIADLRAAGELAHPGREDGGAVVCPFKGLASFEVGDAPYFFGRERLVAELVARAVGARMVAVVGGSGSGKSSVVRAGLLPALRAGVLPGSADWRHAIVRPGEHPMRELRRAGFHDRAGGRFVLVVDQFEELFTACRDEAERAAFVAALASGASEVGDDDALVVVTVRADFYGRLAEHPALASALGANQVLVGSMRRDELHSAIEQPARRAGLLVEPELVDALVADVEREPGGLPLLSSALLELWQRRDGRRLRYASYERTGGVSGAVARLAEDAFARMDGGQREAARAVLLRLAGEGAGGAVVRRRVALCELDDAGDEDIGVVLALLTERRLVTISDTTVEVAHEALLREWPRLRRWLEADADGRRVHRHLADAARDWDERGRDPADLYRGARLAVALEWRTAHEPALNAIERAFLDAGRAAAGRAHRRLQVALAGAVALLALVVLGGVVALHQRTAARTQARLADAQRIGAEALNDADFARSVLLGRQAVALAPSPVTGGDLFSALLRHPAAVEVVRGEGNALTAIDLAPDGRTLAVGGSHGDVEFLDAVTQRRIGSPAAIGARVQSVRFSPDGTRVAVAGYNFVSGNPVIELLDARSHRDLGSLDLGEVTSFHSNPGGVAFSPDSRFLVADYLIAPASLPGEHHFLGLWDGHAGRRLASPRPITATADDRLPRAFGGFIDGGARLVTSSTTDRSTVIRDARTLRPVRRLRIGGAPVDVSPDGRLLALQARDGTARVVNLGTGASRRLGASTFAALRFTPDSRRLVTVGGDGDLAVWDAAGAVRIATVEQDTGGARQVVVSPDGRTAYTAAEDGSVIGWDLTGARRLGRSFAVGPARPAAVAAVPRGSAFVVARSDGSVELRAGEAATLRGTIALRPSDAPTTVAVSPDGHTLALGAVDGTVRFADLRSGRPRGPAVPSHVEAVLALAFSPDGRALVSSGGDNAVYLWDVARGRPIHLAASLPDPATSLSVAPDGRTLAATVVHDDGTGAVALFRLPRLRPLATISSRAGTQIQFARDGRVLYLADDTGLVWALDRRTWKPRGEPLGVTRGAGHFALSPDERVMAITAADGTTRLWDVASRRPIGTALPGVTGTGVETAFVDGGRELITLDAAGRGSVWDVSPQSWPRRACAVAGRTLTPAEWHDALPGRPYAPACAGN